MIPAGYLLKRTSPPPGWLRTEIPRITEVCSLSDCVNDNAVDLQENWKHNGFGLANSPELLWELAQELGVETSASKLFFYSAYERELESDGWAFDPNQWQPLSRVPSSDVADEVTIPPDDPGPILLGYDVVVFNDYLEHSPLSCNSVAKELPVNRFCLFDTFKAAKAAIDCAKFGGGCEPGVYKIFSVSVFAESTA